MDTMDAFSYLWVMVSIVLGVGLTQLFAGIGNLVQIRRRVRLYWLHSLWVLLLIGLHLHMWWSFWALRKIGDWSYGSFVYILFGPAALVIASHIVIPEMNDGRIDVKRYYFDTSRIFFAMLACAAAWAMFLEPVMGLRQVLVPFRGMQLLGFLALLSCSIWRSARVHAAAIVVVVAVLTASRLLAGFGLGQFEVP